MTPEEVPSPSGSAGSSPRPPRRRSHRGGRGRRRPAPRAGAPASAAPPGDEAPKTESQAPPLETAETFSAREETFSSADAPEHEQEDAPRRFDDRDPSPDTEGYESEPPEMREEPVEDRAGPPPRELPPRAPRRVIQPASPAAVTEAIEEVNRIITTLRESLDTMDEILETLELAEVQKTADEREIQSLRNAMRGFDRPSTGEPRRESRGDDRRRGRR